MTDSSGKFYVVIHHRDSRTGRHTRREGPYSKEEAEEKARIAANFPGNYAVLITEGTPYHTTFNTRRIK